jgi:hypothetical protein
VRRGDEKKRKTNLRGFSGAEEKRRKKEIERERN